MFSDTNMNTRKKYPFSSGIVPKYKRLNYGLATFKASSFKYIQMNNKHVKRRGMVNGLTDCYVVEYVDFMCIIETLWKWDKNQLVKERTSKKKKHMFYIRFPDTSIDWLWLKDEMTDKYLASSSMGNGV